MTTLYLKYRPQTISDLDIDSVRQSLTKIVESGKIPHAFLFAGPKGTGKTSAARILSKIINCEKNADSLQLAAEPCNKCQQCLSIANGSNMDVIEMDAASNRGIDDIRALKDTIRLTPGKAKAKVYIIDEAHMLTTEASNALLKTLEEPPDHVYFILATTNPEKLIDTIKSRTTLISFSKATAKETKRSLIRIVKLEKIKISDEDLDKIIKLSNGSFRDAVKILEQYSKDKDFFKNHLDFEAGKLTDLILSKDLKNSFAEIEKAIKAGFSIDNVTEDILEILQKRLIDFGDKDTVTLIEYILKVQEYNKFTPIAELPLQIAIFKWCLS